MSSNIKFNPEMSIYIPYVLATVTKKQIHDVFFDQYIGLIGSIEMVPSQNKKTVSVFIHFDCWFDNVVSRNLQERICDPTKDAKMVYDDPSFWILRENKNQSMTMRVKRLLADISEENVKLQRTV